MTEAEMNSTLATAVTPQMSERELKSAILAGLRQLGSHVQGEETITYEGTRVVLPASFKNNLSAAIRHLDEVRRSEEEKIEFGRTFKYRMWDGAVAFSRAMSELFGVQGIGMVTRSMFGTIPPQIQSVETGLDEHTEAPWGRVGFSAMNAVFEIGYDRDPELGVVSRITCNAPRKFRLEIEGFFDVIGDHLRNNSIYRGKAITAAATPGFFNAYSVRPENVIYTPSVMKQLSANVFAPIRRSQRMREMNMPLNRKVLLHGKYGTGKSLAGVLTAQVAIDNGWTFIIVRSSDNPLEALQTAKMYAPAIVFIEDFDLLTADQDREGIDKVLDTLDSVSTKGSEVMGLFTTNFIGEIDQAALRPGRLDHFIEFGALEEEGYVNLIKSIIPATQMAADISYKSVASALDGLYPAFASEVGRKAILYSLDRDSEASDIITTEDILNAVAGVREQLKVMEDASEAERTKPGLDTVFAEAVAEVLERTECYGDRLKVNPVG